MKRTFISDSEESKINKEMPKNEKNFEIKKFKLDAANNSASLKKRSKKSTNSKAEKNKNKTELTEKVSKIFVDELSPVKNDVTKKNRYLVGVSPQSLFAGPMFDLSTSKKIKMFCDNIDEINPADKKMKDQISRNKNKEYKNKEFKNSHGNSETENYNEKDESLEKMHRIHEPSLLYQQNRAESVYGGEQDFMVPNGYYVVAKKQKSKRQTSKKKAKIRICSNCCTTQTPSWRRGASCRELLCNACGLYLKLHGRNRPFAVNQDGKTKALKNTSTDAICVVCGTQQNVTEMIRTPNGASCLRCSDYFNRQVVENNIQIDPYREGEYYTLPNATYYIPQQPLGYYSGQGNFDYDYCDDQEYVDGYTNQLRDDEKQSGSQSDIK